MNRMGLRSRLFVSVTIAAVLIVATAQAAFAAPGDPDTSFDSDGVATFDHGGNETAGLVAQGPGGLYVAGQSGEDLFVLRVKSNGDPDTAYGDNGFAVVDLGGSDIPYGLAVDADGSAFVAATRMISGAQRGAVVKLTRDGDPDPGFGGGDGIAFVGNGADDVYIEGVALQPDGKILAVGESDPPSGDSSVFLTVRLKAAGAFDPTFDHDGRVLTAFGDGFDGGWRVLVQPDAKIVVGGWMEEQPGSSDYDPAFARYLPNGALDTTFGRKGRSIVSLYEGGDDYVNDLELAPGGKFAVCLNGGTSAVGFFAVMRLTPKGKADITFGGGDGSAVLASFPDTHCSDLSVQADGKFVATGDLGDAGHFAAVRFTKSGRLDRGFGAGGVAAADFGVPGDQSGGIAVQGNGRIVVAGTVFSPNDVAVARFLP